MTDSPCLENTLQFCRADSLNKPEVEVFPRTPSGPQLCMGRVDAMFIRSVTVLAQDPASPAPSLPCRSLHHADVLRTTAYSPLAIAVPSAPTIAAGWLGCVLPASYAVSDRAAHGSVGCTGVNRCAIQHNSVLSKVGQLLRKAPLGVLPLRALRVRIRAIMSCAPVP